jgi:hypothetical protein
MKILQLLLHSIINVLFASFSPNLFGSRKRRKAYESMQGDMLDEAEDTQAEIDNLKSVNPFESAAAKSAMKTASRNAKQMSKRYANMMGGGATPEAMVAAQGASQEAVGSAAGQIAAGAESTKASQVANLQNMRQSQLGQANQLGSSAAAEIGTGWSSFFNEALPAMSGLMSGAGQAAGAVGEGGGASAIMAALSDRRLKENIEYIGELQGHKVYKYNFIGDPSVVIGVMADEVEKTDPKFVVKDGDISKVRYDKIFKTVKE